MRKIWLRISKHDGESSMTEILISSTTKKKISMERYTCITIYSKRNKADD